MKLSARLACQCSFSAGRAVEEQECPNRSFYQRDRDRIIHSTAFRRLEGKTQVFTSFTGDHFRTRLTHSLEVAQIARSMARMMGLDEDMAEAIALAHDLGHCAFGHAGEKALDEAAVEIGGFDHNLQTLRILTKLELRYANFDGLNLTAETLEGIIKHNGPVLYPGRTLIDHPLFESMKLEQQGHLEGQVAAISDDIAYCNHDLDDGLRSGILPLEDLALLPVAGPFYQKLIQQYPGLDRQRLIQETIRRAVNAMIRDVFDQTMSNLKDLKPETLDDVRNCGQPMVAFSENMNKNVAGLRAYLFKRLYHNFNINRAALKGERIVKELYAALCENPDCLPDRWRAVCGSPRSLKTQETVRDYIAGMTDRFALQEHQHLIDPGPSR